MMGDVIFVGHLAHTWDHSQGNKKEDIWVAYQLSFGSKKEAEGIVDEVRARGRVEVGVASRLHSEKGLARSYIGNGVYIT